MYYRSMNALKWAEILPQHAYCGERVLDAVCQKVVERPAVFFGRPTERSGRKAKKVRQLLAV